MFYMGNIFYVFCKIICCWVLIIFYLLMFNDLTTYSATNHHGIFPLLLSLKPKPSVQCFHSKYTPAQKISPTNDNLST